MNICLIGAGKLAWSLIPALQKARYQVVQLLNRDASQAAAYAKVYHIPHSGDLEQPILPTVDLVWLTVADAALAEVAHQMAAAARPDRYWVHSSGSMPRAVIAPLGEHTGVIYPLQVFNSGSLTPLDTAPIFIEAPAGLLPRLQEVATRLSSKVIPLSGEARLRLHLGAVLACNFPTFLWRLASEQLPEGLTLEVYEPLMAHTLQQVLRLGPQAAQTGPALRGDAPTLAAHQALLSAQPDIQQLYATFSRLIQAADHQKEAPFPET